ncbi:MAG: histidinol-phosphatase [Spartobacteria bacterium AMD-G4]|jgi:DNA polymerase (family 10)|nr:MAG: histidinol-phosphatase [Spartobacteria bacterium AMD-G4]
MNKDEIAGVFENIARLLELKGENPFKVRAYTHAARALEALSEPLETLIAEERLTAVDGIGKATGEKITELSTHNRLDYYDHLREEFPPDILTLFEIQGLGAKKIKALWDTLKVHSVTSLERACKDGSVAALPGFGEKTAANILKGIEHMRSHAGEFLFGDVAHIAEGLLDDLRGHPDVNLAQIAGSFRRKKEIVRDLDFIVSTKQPEAVMAFFTTHPLVENVLAHGATKSSVILKSGIQCDLRAVTGPEFPFALNYFTGSKEHNVRMRSRALSRGWSLNEYRFSAAEGRELREPLPEVHEEADIYRALGLDPVEPELREDRGEIDAAEKHKLPHLIEWTNLRGTFHNHTTASDGRATLENMVAAAKELGLEYLGIADHSKASFQANGLDETRLAAQVARIAELNAADKEFRIFAGTECDILKDGSLDFADEVLATLDYVVASVHSSFTMPEAEMTNRIIRAMENPHVTMLGHLTGRLLLSREPYQLNIPAILDAAAATGTIIELNANPRRLDLDWRWWPLAKEKGVKCAINPDAHTTAGLQDLLFGVGVARKGWLTKNDVINTLPLTRIESILKAKRSA